MAPAVANGNNGYNNFDGTPGRSSSRLRLALQDILAAEVEDVVREACTLPGALGCLEDILERLRKPEGLPPGGSVERAGELPGAAAGLALSGHVAGGALPSRVWANWDREGNPIDWSARVQECSVCRARKPASDFSGKALKKLRRRGLDSDATCRDCLQFARSRRPDAQGVGSSDITSKGGLRGNYGLPDHLEKVFAKGCFPHMMKLGLFPGAKDVSEAYGALHAVWQHFAVAAEDAGVLCVSIGDGSTPRAAGLAAFLTRWRCVAVDPGLRAGWTGEEPQGVQRLHGIRAAVEDFAVDGAALARARGSSPAGGHRPTALVLLGVHSHHRYRGAASIQVLRSSMGVAGVPACVVSVPCCFPFRDVEDLGRRPDVCYDDWAILSEKREVRVWLFGAG